MTVLPTQTLDHIRLRRALDKANLAVLLPIVAQLTGDLSWIEAPFTPARIRGLVDDDHAGLPFDVQEEVREAAFRAVTAWHAGTPAALPEPDRSTLQALMSSSIGKDAPEEYSVIFAEDLTLRGDRHSDEAPTSIATDAIIVGAGLSGMRAAIEFRRRGIPFVIFEQNEDVGGVWLTSTYPGAGVDTPTQLYSLSTDPYPWTSVFPRQADMHDYANFIADNEELRESITFGAEVTGARWIEASQEWSIQVSFVDGRTETHTASVLVSAVGTFAGASLPDIPGIADFEGTVVHTAHWPNDLDLTGKRVAVVGAGASAMQLVPAIVDRVGELIVFQRTPQWIAPVADYFDAIPPEVNDLLELVPLYREWWRFRLATIWNDGAYPSLGVDRDWEDFPRSVNRINASQRRYYERYLREQLEGRDDLIELSIPDYAPFGKRLLLDNGWFAAIRKEHVTVVPHGVSALGAHTITDDGGDARAVDVVIFATGYTAVNYLSTLPVTGRDDVVLDDFWEHDNAAAYLGMTVPCFPNFFVMYGPNTHPGPGGSYLFVAEVAAGYIADAIEHIERFGGGSLDVRQDVFDAYREEVDETNASLVWGSDLVRSYVKNSRGRVVIYLPWRVSDYWLRAHEFHADDYQVRSAVNVL